MTFSRRLLVLGTKLQRVASRRVRVVLLALWTIAALSVPVAQVGSADNQSCVVSDPEGDTSAPGYMDMVENGIARLNGQFVLHTTVAAQIPTDPVRLPNGVNEVWWHWGLNTDPASFPTGFPFASGLTAPAEFVAFVAWDGQQFEGFLVDRRANVPGGVVNLMPIDFEIEGATVRAMVNAELLENPTSFVWVSFTFAWMGEPGSQGFTAADRVGPTLWPC